MQLPNPNKDGTASVGMMQLSLQETSTNYLQGIYEEIGSLKIIHKQDNLLYGDYLLNQEQMICENLQASTLLMNC